MFDLLTAALAAAERGWPVFMLGRSKRPIANCPACRTSTGHDPQACRCLTCHGFYAATRDPDRIRAMIATVSTGQLAVRTGAPSRTIVVDVDPAHCGAHTLRNLIEAGTVTQTTRVLTGSGGLHLYYRHPGEDIPNSQGRLGIGLGPGIDVRGDGGYAVLPPSIHPRTGRRYQWATDDHELAEMTPLLIAACKRTPPAPPRAFTGSRAPEISGVISRPDRLLSTLLDRLARAEEGTRRTTLYGIARGVARIVATGHLSSAQALDILTDAGRDADQSDRDIDNAIHDAFRAEGMAL